MHILSIFFDKFNTTGEKREAIQYTLGHSGLAIAMTSVTTAIGVGSFFLVLKLNPFSDLGMFASLGVMISLFFTLTPPPALLSITKMKQKVKTEAGKLDRFMKRLAVIPVKHYRSIIALSAVLVVVALFAATKIELSHNPLKWFQPDSYDRVSTEVIDEALNGSVTIELIIDTQKRERME